MVADKKKNSWSIVRISSSKYPSHPGQAYMSSFMYTR